MKRRSLLVLTWSVFCLFAIACTVQQPPTNSNQTPSNQANTPLLSQTPSESPTLSSKANPEQLIAKIKQLQGEYVRDSTGIEADEAFTVDDLNQFISDKKTTEIVERLKKDNDFRALVNAIKEMGSEKRSDLLDRGLKTYRKPWSELHLNPKTASADELRRGQTVMGSKAEKLIAQAVVDLVRQMI